ncbi:hypothetical protein CRG98_031005 [Punica granatum]|uniref:Uncharacterized protein n=1 Tax=Punica granatum TaxID=22663 RepID=A0A2I0IYT3_PUNGR|nr:hypothetical protein CRG98_031005 [Punica granatum]
MWRRMSASISREREISDRNARSGEFLKIERRFGVGAFYEGAPAKLQGLVSAQPSNGRVLPPQLANADEETPMAAALCRFPVSLTRICSGGVG